MINLYVDDLRDIPRGFIGARSYNDALYFLRLAPIDVLSLDHDLGENAYGHLLPTGDDLVNWIIEYGATKSPLIINRIYLHTDNPVGRDRMYKALTRAKERGFIHKRTTIHHYPITHNKYTDPTQPS